MARKPHKIYSINGTAQAAAYARGDNDIVPDTGIRTGRKAPAQKFFNYGMMTEGEMDLSLMLAQIQLKKQAYEDPAGIYARAEQEITNRLLSGLHNAGQRSVVGVQPPELNRLFTNIQAATRKGNPAGIILNREERPSINMGFDPSDLPNQVDCNRIYQDRLAEIRALGFSADFESIEAQRLLDEATREFNLCKLQATDIAALNGLINEAGPNLLYIHDNSLVSSNYSYRNKYNTQSNIVTAISENSSLSYSTLLNWLRYSVMLKNSQKGGIPASPEDSISSFRSKALVRIILQDNGIDPSVLDDFDFEGAGINGLVITLVIVAIAAIVSLAVIESVSRSQNLKKSLDYSLALSNLGESPVAPELLFDFARNSYSAAEYAKMVTSVTSAGLLAGTVGSGNGNGSGSGGFDDDFGGGGGGQLQSNNTGLLIGGGLLAAFALLNR